MQPTKKQPKVTLQDLLAQYDKERLTAQHFADSFGKVLDVFVKMKQMTAQQVVQIKADLAQHAVDLKNKHDKSIADIQGQVKDALNKHTNAIDARLATIRDGDDGLDGKDADETTIVQTVLAQIPAPVIPASYDDSELKEAIESHSQEIEKIKTVIPKDNKTPGWGAHPLTIQQSGTTKAKTARFLNFTGATVTQSTNGVTTVAITGGSSGFQQPTSGTVNGTNKVFVWATAPNVIVVDGRPLQATGSDGTVNWTGTTTTTLIVAPVFDIYATA